ncbi:NADH:flavorubredoxin reductase NorW [Vibrio europaeus]|uniref:NADH:flavorubredoxin reductase NorW n=1 Tax=Vibrio europaeus TaxID=300876 RepID=UPI00233E9AB6|nr:NADH:flavorubredoxin reductase NorW [Vibrio europaeus]MDC5856678.1 NADH:flavorubredoxin reductase NorW [Vibrio europaeus]
MNPIIIVGGGFAALQTIKMLRKTDEQIAIELITADEGIEYNKPSLSHVFSKEQQPDELVLNTAQELAEQYNVTIRTNTLVNHIDVEEHCVYAEGNRYLYSKLVLATGASTFIPPTKGLQRDDVLTLNSLEEFKKCKSQVDAAQRIAVVGGGLIGVELALDLRIAGKQVTIIEPATYLLGNLIPPFVSIELERELTDLGIGVETSSSIEKVSKVDDGLLLQTSVPRYIEVDEVIAAAGIRPNIALAEQAGLKTNRGIVVDSAMATSAKDVYAIGDCAEMEGRILAYLQPAILAANVLAKQLTTGEGSLVLPHIMTKVKTPSYPIQLAGRDADTACRWEAEFLSDGIKAKAYNDENKLVGFVVTGQHSKAAFPLLRELQSS